MSIDAITLDHVGNYSCRALFFDDTEDWYSDELIVRAAPSWRVEPPSKVQIQSSSGGILNCQAEGSPRPHHSWENDKGQLVHNGSSLSIPARSDLQSGGGTHNFEVTCVADNGIGPSIRKTVYVTISGTYTYIKREKGGKASLKQYTLSERFEYALFRTSEIVPTTLDVML